MPCRFGSSSQSLRKAPGAWPQGPDRPPPTVAPPAGVAAALYARRGSPPAMAAPHFLKAAASLPSPCMPGSPLATTARVPRGPFAPPPGPLLGAPRRRALPPLPPRRQTAAARFPARQFAPHFPPEV
eukprot:10342741-Lingulodinium_polyedra.AAC.1